jgi:hypothetical protein
MTKNDDWKSLGKISNLKNLDLSRFAEHDKGSYRS